MSETDSSPVDAERSTPSTEAPSSSSATPAAGEGAPSAATPEDGSSASVTPNEGDKSSASVAPGEGDGPPADPPKKKRRRRRRKKPAASPGEENSASADAPPAAKQVDAGESDARRSATGKDQASPGRGRNEDGARGRGRREGGRREGGRREGGRREGGRREGGRREGGRREGGRREGGRRPRVEAEGSGRGGATLKVSLFAALANTREFDDFSDKEVVCRNAGCEQRWTWSREAQVALQVRGAAIKPPKRQCDGCWAKERALSATPVECRVRGCSETWIWDVDAQLRHRAWFEREKARHESEAHGTADESSAPPATTPTEGGEPSGRGKKRSKRKKKRAAPKEGPPAKLCGRCEAKIKTLETREVTCKVHGCGQQWKWNKEQQLEAWAKLDVQDGSVTPKNPRRMCNRCFDFCRKHQDRQVECGKPGCDRTWSYPVGAQLQDHLGGRAEPNRRLACDFSKAAEDCEFRVAMRQQQAALPPGSEQLPCIVAGCASTWIFSPGMVLAVPEDGAPDVDRMCDHHRRSFGAAPRGEIALPVVASRGTDAAGDDDGDEVAAATASEAIPSPTDAASAPDVAASPDEARASDEASASDEARSSDGGSSSVNAPAPDPASSSNEVPSLEDATSPDNAASLDEASAEPPDAAPDEAPGLDGDTDPTRE